MTYGIKELMCLQGEKMATATANAVTDFGSAGEEDYSDIHSPTDSSEDSVEVKVLPISSRNKRKCAEPRKVQDAFTGPLKKRMCLKVQAEVAGSHPFRPWSPQDTPSKQDLPTKATQEHNSIVKKEHFEVRSESPVVKSEHAEVNSDRGIGIEFSKTVSNPVRVKTEIITDQSLGSVRNDKLEQHPYVLPSFVVPKVPIIYQPSLHLNTHKYGYFRPPSPIKLSSEDQPVSLIKKQDTKDSFNLKEDCFSDNTSQPSPRVPVHPQIATLSTAETERLILNTTESFPSLQNKSKSDQTCSSRREQRNYKNMTRERRIEANARERTRVHTISAAFDTLRRSVPAYSHNQKLSKLSVLRIACSYIRTLSNIVEGDDSAMSESVDTVSKTIQREGKLRKKKDDND